MDADLFPDLVDYVLPELPPYEFTLYVLLLRTSDWQGGLVRLGKRTIAARLGKGTRATNGNYQHISEKLDHLARFGFIRVGDTTREGTSYEVLLPRQVPSIRERIVANQPEEAAPDYFTDVALRAELMEREGWRCHYCGESVDAGTATLDHIIPRSLGGPNTPENLTTACLMCNSIKSGRTYIDAAPDMLTALARRR